MNDTARLTRGSIRGHLIGQTLPMVVGVAALMSVGLVNAYFIGRLGAEELAAVAFIFPVTIAISSMGVGVMVGINSVIARALGAGDVERAARRANFGAVFALGVGVAIALAMFVLIDPLFRLMQVPEPLLPLIRDYMRPYAIGLPLLLVQMGLNGVLRGQGEARAVSYVALSYAAINWVLNPVLIEGMFGLPAMGVAGAAWATNIGFALAGAMALWLIGKTPLPINPGLIRQCRMGESAGAILRVAGPAAFSNAINPIGLAVLTALLASEGQAAVAGFGAAGRLQSFAVVPLLALSGSIGAIVGQNWGAALPDRARRAMLEAALFCLGYGLAVAVLLYAFGDPLAQLFTDDPLVAREFKSYLAFSVWGYAGFGLLITANGALNAVDHARFALMQSFARVFLLMLPFAWLLRGAWGAEAIYAAELVANLGGGALAALIVWRVLRVKPANVPVTVR
jgi:putative MATE family efflux protein